MTRQYNYRKDQRTDKQFAEDMRSFTRKERFLADLFVKEMEFLGVKIVLHDHGVDNSGKLIKEEIKAHEDFIFEYVDLLISIKADVKSCYTDKQCTFKLSNLKKYVTNHSYILLFYNTGDIKRNVSKFDYEKARWTLIHPLSIKQMIEDKKNKIMKPKYFGYKECIEIKKKEYSSYFISKPLESVSEYDD